VPFQRELAVAAVVDGGEPEVEVDEDVAACADIAPDYIDAQVKQELKEIERRRRAYLLQGRARVPLGGRTVILVDGGIATGASGRAAVRALRRKP
jgi:putative phosphoribosyl transferase